MKRNLLITILLICILPGAFSQDRIITLKNDTINCKIIKISHNKIFFELSTSGVKSSGDLPLNGVLNYTVSQKTEAGGQIVPGPVSFNRLQLGLSTGAGYLLGSTEQAKELLTSQGLTSAQADSYYKDLKTGLYADACLNYFFSPVFGAGIKYKFFDTSGSIEGFFDPQDGVNLIYARYKEQIYVNFIGGSFVFQQFIGSRNTFQLNSKFSAGLTTYRNEAEYLNGYFLLQGKSVGFDTSIGLEYFMSERISLSSDLSLFYSAIHKMKVSDGTNTATVTLDKKNFENLSRLELSIGIRIYLWNR
jgi:hypothetical protein